jgi:hypothetical protein
MIMHVACRETSGACSGAASVVTTNISAGGALFRTVRWRDFPVGAKVDYTLFLSPELSGAGWHCSRLSGMGKVTRHETLAGPIESDWRAVAVSFDRSVLLG